MLEVRLALPEDDERPHKGRMNPRETATETPNLRSSSAFGLKASHPLLISFDRPTCSAFP